jgi:Ca2+-binding EF-hand superfamily protein
MCGMEVIDEMYEFDNSTFTMPTNLIWEDCWMEDNETVCEQGEIYYDVNTTMLWETTHENNYMDCDGDYDNNTSMCTELIGNITDADGSAFLIQSDWGDTLLMYQYDEATQSGLVISVESDDGDDFDPEMWFDMFDADEDGEVTASEWADMMNQSGEGMTEDDWNGLLMMIEMFDEDNSSGLNFSEFVNMMENMDDMGDDDDHNGEWSFDREVQDCDSDGDAMVSYAELEACINEDLVNDGFDFVNASDMGAHEFFNMSDMDNDGMLNESEFNELNQILSSSDDDDDDDMDPETMFELFDSNDDGEVTASEWSDFTNQTDDPMSEEDFGFLESIMDSYDEDESGGLDLDEFMNFMNSMEDMEDGDGSDEDISMFMVFGVMDFGADPNDYSVELAMCEGMSLTDLDCGDSVYSVQLASIMASTEEQAMIAMMTQPVVFVDADSSGTLTNSDYIMINNATLEADGEWNFARLYSSEAGAYSDENPMMSMLPGFTGFIATIGLLGAALIRRE